MISRWYRALIITGIVALFLFAMPMRMAIAVLPTSIGSYKVVGRVDMLESVQYVAREGVSDSMLVILIGFGPLAPTNFTLTMASPSQVDIAWTKGVGATYTVVRRGTEGYPVSPTEGVEIYEGAGITVSDASVDTESFAYYYRAWSWNDYGYSSDYAQGRIGGTMIQMLVLGILALGLTIAAYYFKKQVLAFAAAGLWFFYGFYNYQMSASEWDLNYGIFFFSMFMGIASIVEVMFIRQRKGEDDLTKVSSTFEDDEPDEFDEEDAADLALQKRQNAAQQQARADMRESMGGRRGRRRRKAKGGKFSDKALRKFEEKGQI